MPELAAVTKEEVLDTGGAKQTAKDLFAGAMGGAAQVLLGGFIFACFDVCCLDGLGFFDSGSLTAVISDWGDVRVKGVEYLFRTRGCECW